MCDRDWMICAAGEREECRNMKNVVSGTTDCGATGNWGEGGEPGPPTQIRSDEVVTESNL